MKISRFLYVVFSIICFLIGLSAFFTHFVMHIITFIEMVELVLFCFGTSALLLILKEDDPIGQLLSNNKVNIKSEKLLYVAILSILLGISALCDGFFTANEASHKTAALFFGVTFLLFGFIIIRGRYNK